MGFTVARSGNTYDFFVLNDNNSRSPTWLRETRRTITPRLGTGNQTYHQVGYEPYTYSANIRIDNVTDYDGMAGFQGGTVSLSDGTSTWVTTLDVFDVVPIAGGLAGYEGRVVFIGRT